MIRKRAKKKENTRDVKSPVTLDVVESANESVKVVGWYVQGDVVAVKLVDHNGAELQQVVSSIPRPDVEAIVGQPALGFRVDCDDPAFNAESCLKATLASGETLELKLVVKMQAASQVGNKKSEHGGTNRTALGGACDRIICCDQNVIFIGWILEYSAIEAVDLVTEDDKLVSEGTVWIRTERPDVLSGVEDKFSVPKPGVFARFGLKGPRSQVLNDKLKVRFKTEEGYFSVAMGLVEDYLSDKSASLSHVLQDWDPRQRTHRDIAPSLLLPAVYDFSASASNTAAVRVDHGHTIKNPRASVLIPLYGRFDFMRFQLSAFSRYGGTEDLEIIYIVDDPSIENGVAASARELFATFGLSFSVVYLESNVGFGMANNIGASFASAERLILLNSDALPADGHWAATLLDHLDTLPQAGMLGVRLLFDDHSIQHDGMAPMIDGLYPELYLNDHPVEGCPLSLSPYAAVPEETLLVTAACVAIKKSLFDELEGFDSAYILGDFEDSDLCLRAAAKGKINYMCRDVTLYHLERLSQNLVAAGNWKHKLTLANAITYNQRWRSSLEPVAE